MKSTVSTSKHRPGWLGGIALLAAVLLLFFWQSFLPGYVHFANDGPLGQQMTAWSQFPSAFTGLWVDLNNIGSNGGSAPVCVNSIVHWMLGPVGFAKFLTPIALLILGIGAWAFFRQLRLAPLAVTLGALAVMLNSTFFSGACWGVAPQEIGFGMDFIALALMVSIQPTTPMLQRWVRIALAGFAVGVNIMEAADIGALFSMFVAAYIIYYSVVAGRISYARIERNVMLCGVDLLSVLALGFGAWAGIDVKLLCLLAVAVVVLNWALLTKYAPANRAGQGAVWVAVIAFCATIIAAYALSGLIGTQIKGVVGMQQDTETRAKRWNEATQWSLHKAETLSLLVPGVFGYRMDSPDGGNYWGAMGREPALEQYYDSGQKGNPPRGFMRFAGGGNYTGVLVVLVGLWAALQSFRRSNSVFTPVERRLVWFWAATVPISLLLAYGRFAPVYQFLYALPYFSTIRNPAKFLNIISFALVVLFAYGIHGLSRRYLEPALSNVSGLTARLKGMWAKPDAFDRRWTTGCLAAIGASLLGWWIYGSYRPALEQHLEVVQMGALASEISHFSVRQVGWFILFLVAAVGVLTLVLSGALAGRRARWGAVLVGLVLVVDLGRANLPWVIFWDYPKKYETYGPNPVIQFLRKKPYEHRVAALPDSILTAVFQLPPEVLQAVDRFSGLYGIEWNQQLFPFYNIQTLDLIQRPRTPEDIAAYEMALSVQSPDTLRNLGRRWQLTNTRYLVGFVGFIDALNAYFDPDHKRFRVVERFELVPKPGVTDPRHWEDMTAELATNGTFAMIEFTGALPRAKLYSTWQMAGDDPAALNELKTRKLGANDLACLQRLGTNDFLTLKTLASPSFDPAQTVLLASPIPASTNGVGNRSNPGTVEFTSYASKDIRLQAQSEAPSILLLNDKYDPEWQVRVDGKQAELLRCNFIMRGVYLPPGSHTVEFLFRPDIRPLYMNVAGVGAAILLIGVALLGRNRSGATGEVSKTKPGVENTGKK